MTVAVFDFPTSVELREIEQELLPRFTEDRPIFRHFPIESKDENQLAWEQKDNYTGLQNLRGMNGAPRRVQMVGHNKFLMRPGIYGDFIPVDEEQLTERRERGTFGTPISINDLVRENQELLLQRRLDRIELTLWTLASTGTFSVLMPDGGVQHTDSYPIRQITSLFAWSNHASATPLQDMRQAKIAARGYSVDFGNTAIAYCNQTTLNNAVANTNAADLYGRRVTGLATPNNQANVNQLLFGEDLPQLQVYDRGYLDESGKFNLFIPDNTVIIVGRRPANQVLGNYRMTRNASNPNMEPGPYTRVVDSAEHGRPVPRNIDVHDGHNGGPVIYWPSAILIMNV